MLIEEAFLDKLIKPELIQLLLNTEANLGSIISNLSAKVKVMLNHFKELEADVTTVRNVNDKLVERLVQTEKQYWENFQYYRGDTLELVGIPNSVD